ncbi:hypothetical protein OEZ85_005107 [Tetradesmus obliquus]|uniref:Uncharacterized protein n=1 Tax=Tetradesmus obliquus TaxID=3088 RepID=A0ABY8UGT7_TETOB|nr:hypothetical protein OEZ85_005107 [Tetradesmus obliquus]
MEPIWLSEAGRDALGYVGGGILALSLLPQVVKLLLTRSAADISLLWSLLYLLGTVLSLVYLLLIDALAGAIPVIFELAGCLLTLSLKLAYDHTAWGKEQQQQKAAALQEQILCS